MLGGPKATYLYVQFLFAKVSNNLVAFCSTVQNLFSVGSHKCERFQNRICIYRRMKIHIYIYIYIANEEMGATQRSEVTSEIV